MTELTAAWKSGEAGRQTPPVIVEVTKGTPSVHSGSKESAFNERWQGVLNRPATLDPGDANARMTGECCGD
jgi:hypothetical protein